jgi:CubicO group peptidase (beta-lactamase class C family)
MDTVTPERRGFGLGFRVVVSAGQSGQPASECEYRWGGTASTTFFVDPKEQLMGPLLTQLIPSRYYPIRVQFKILTCQASLTRAIYAARRRCNRSSRRADECSTF